MKTISLLFLSLFLAFPLSADRWQGQHGSRRFYLETDYSLSGTFFTAPEVWIQRAACDSLCFSGDTLYVGFNKGQVRFRGVPSPSREKLEAVIALYGKEYEVTLAPVDSLMPHSWPQNPVAPYPYIEEEIVVPVNDTILLSGTLTRPRSRKRVPAVILLSLSVWGALLGFIGLIIALPLTTLIIAYYQRYVTKENVSPTPPADSNTGSAAPVNAGIAQENSLKVEKTGE